MLLDCAMMLELTMETQGEHANHTPKEPRTFQLFQQFITKNITGYIKCTISFDYFLFDMLKYWTYFFHQNPLTQSA